MGHQRLQESYKASKFINDSFPEETRINLNDLLQRRKEEKKVDKKTNLFIFSGASAVLAVVVVILTL